MERAPWPRLCWLALLGWQRKGTRAPFPDDPESLQGWQNHALYKGPKYLKVEYLGSLYEEA